MLPSSPPLLPQDDSLPSSPPPLPRLDSYNSKKRRHSDYASNSSDPVFSEDPSEAELCSADSEPRKKHIRAPWWALSKSKRVVGGGGPRRRHRNNDSGVWMQSDDSVASLSSQQSAESSDVASKDESVVCKPGPATLVHDRIQAALESGKEVIDLGDCGLQTITNEMLRPLHQMIKQPHDHDNYRPLTPELQLYLQSNALSILPTELFRLDNITVLSLRNNNLQVLPHQIGQLRNLQELNVASNQLRCLPWEILGMTLTTGPLRRLIFHPNSAYDLPEGAGHTSSVAYLKQWTAIRAPKPNVFWGLSSTSRMTYFDKAGRQLDDNARSRADAAPDTMPSLFELALQRISKTHTSEEALACLEVDTPSSVFPGLQMASYAAAAGMAKCSTCSRPLITARAQWIEWWTRHHCGGPADEAIEIYPFAKQACSYACAIPSTTTFLV